MRNFVIGLIVGAVLMLVLPRIVRRNAPNSAIKTEVKEIIVRDTIIAYKPLEIERRVTDTIKVVLRDSICVRDTIYLSRETKVYEDSLYRAVVSGYEPRLESIAVYPQTRYVVTSTTERKESRFGVGFQIGLGAGAKGFTPYIGVGVQYNIWNFDF